MTWRTVRCMGCGRTFNCFRSISATCSDACAEKYAREQQANAAAEPLSTLNQVESYDYRDERDDELSRYLASLATKQP